MYPDTRMVQVAGHIDRLMGWMGSLADPTRLRLLRLLEQQELGVAELCDVLQLPQSTVSRHLKVLADESWAVSRRQGTVHLYRMASADLDPPARRLWLVAREQTEPWPAVRQDQLRLARRLQERRSESDAFFASAAGQWDKLRDEIYGRAFSEQAMLSLLPEDATVADLGCGTGQVAARLAPWVGRVIGVDSSAAMLRAAKTRAEDLSNVDLRRGDLTAIPIDEGVCDAALMLLVLSYVADPQAALREMARVLKPTGRAVVVDLLPHDREDFRQRLGQRVLGFDLENVRAMMKAAGLTVVRAIALPPEPDVKGPAMFLATAKRS
jgi:ubiquinone/menaquinone biosynthesis C-methylase UbiE